MRSLLLISAFVITASSLHAQQGGIPITTPSEADTPNTASGDDLMAMLDDEAGPAKPDYVTATFKATRVVNGHSVENMGKGVMSTLR